MPHSGHSALHGVNPNFKKNQFENPLQFYRTVEKVEICGYGQNL